MAHPSSSRILITRPEADAAILSDRLISMGFEPLLNPLLTVAYQDGPAIDLNGVQAILITSANGIRAFIQRNKERDLPVFTVGDASAQVARDEGFKHVQSADGDVQALAELIKKQLIPGQGTLLHIAASRVAGDLLGNLQKDGFQVKREVLYTAQGVEHLQTETIEAMKQGQLAAVLLYSPRTAKTFVSLIRAAGLEAACRSITIFCLSAAVAQVVSQIMDETGGEITWGDIQIASQPKQEALLNAVAAWSKPWSKPRSKQ